MTAAPWTNSSADPALRRLRKGPRRDSISKAASPTDNPQNETALLIAIKGGIHRHSGIGTEQGLCGQEREGIAVLASDTGGFVGFITYDQAGPA